MYNKIIGIGHLVKDPESRTTSTSKQVCTFRVCISDSQAKNKCFIDCECWDKLAEICAKFLKKGKEIMVEGELCMSSWTGKDGSTQTKPYIRADKVKFMNSSPKPETSGDERDESTPQDSSAKKSTTKSKESSQVASEDEDNGWNIPF
jgi:single-strand DNA-binding protein